MYRMVQLLLAFCVLSFNSSLLPLAQAAVLTDTLSRLELGTNGHQHPPFKWQLNNNLSENLQFEHFNLTDQCAGSSLGCGQYRPSQKRRSDVYSLQQVIDGLDTNLETSLFDQSLHTDLPAQDILSHPQTKTSRRTREYYSQVDFSLRALLKDFVRESELGQTLYASATSLSTSVESVFDVQPDNPQSRSRDPDVVCQLQECNSVSTRLQTKPNQLQILWSKAVGLLISLAKFLSSPLFIGSLIVGALLVLFGVGFGHRVIHSR